MRKQGRGEPMRKARKRLLAGASSAVSWPRLRPVCQSAVFTFDDGGGAQSRRVFALLFAFFAFVSLRDFFRESST
jgi:hypothetical protein